MFLRFFNFWPPSNGLSHIFSTAYKYPFFLTSFFFCLKISLVFSPKPPKLLLTQPTKFPPQNTSKSSPWIFQMHPMRSLKLHAYFNYLQTPVFVYLPQQKPHSPTPGGNSQNIRLPRQTHKKKTCLLVALPLWRDLFETISVDQTTKSPKHSTVLPNSRYWQTSTKKKTAWYHQRPKYWFS